MDKYEGFLILALVVTISVWLFTKTAIKLSTDKKKCLVIKKSEESTSHIPKCPTCGSTAVEKISVANKVGAAFLFGVFSLGHLSKSFKCQNCNYKW